MRIATMITCLAIAGCATTADPGWEGEQAMPFDAAQTRCRDEAQAAPQGPPREDAFETCMARHGWTRPAD